MGIPHFLQATASLLALLLIYKVWVLLKASRKRKAKSAPEPCGAWPLLGHLLLLKDPVPTYRTFGSIADKLGPIFSLRIGSRPALVISSWEAARDCFKTNDKVLLNRPPSAASKFMGYNHAVFALCPYGTYWRDIRKFAMLHLLSNTRLDQLKHDRLLELETGIRNLYSLCCYCKKTGSAAVNMSEWIANVTVNMTMRMIVRKRLQDDETQRLNRAITKLMYLTGMILVSDVIPFTEWLDLQGHVWSMKSVAKDLDYIITNWLEEQLQSKQDGQVIKEEQDFVNAMFSSLANEDSISICGHNKKTIVKSTALNMIAGGSHTTLVTLTWALSLLLNHPEVLQHAQDELDNQVGHERWVEESDFKNLPYLQAIIKETLRLYPALPLSIPREAMEDCYIGGFYVRKGTLLVVNLWKLHRDPRIWSNPCEFQPSRFLDCNSEFNVRGQQFEYIPFSSGRRSCPGISSAMQMNCLILARVLQGFNLSTPKNAPVDMTAGFGGTLPKATPLEVILTPCLPYNLY